MPEFQDHTEVEWQFDVDDLGVLERWLAEPPGSIRVDTIASEPDEHLDTYYDTTDWRVYRAGYALRLRQSKGHAELTLKALDAAIQGYSQRREATQSLVNVDTTAIDHVRGPVGDRVMAIRGTNATIPLFTAVTQRKRFQLWCEETEIGELALDNTTFIGESFEDQSQLMRVEIETTIEQAESLQQFVAAIVAACDARPAPASKFQTGLSILGLHPSVPVRLGSLAFGRRSSIVELAIAVLRRHFEVLLRREPGTRLGDDVEELHDMRVSARRLRAAIALFSPYLPPDFAKYSDELRWVAAALGEVRDLDVQIAEIQGWKERLDSRDASALDPLFAELNRRWEAARERMLTVLDSERYEHFVAEFTDRLTAGMAHDESERAVVIAPGLVLQRYKKFRRRAGRLRSTTPDEAFHRVRIDGKRLRYALEFVSPLYGKNVREFIVRLVGVQDLLGRHQDSIVAIDHLRDIAVDIDAGLPPATVFAMGRIAEGYAAAAVDARNRFLEVYKQMRGKRFERLERELRHRSRRRPAKQVEAVETTQTELQVAPVPQNTTSQT